MTAYLVAYGTHPGDRFLATAHPDRGAAVAAAAQQPAGFCALVIETQRDVTLSGSNLVAAFNALTGGSVHRFESREVGVRRFLEALASLSPPDITQTKGTDMARSNTAAAETGTTSTNGAEKKSRRRLLPDEGVITVLAEKNPQRAGSKSHDMHAKYHSGMTVKQALDAGVTMSHIIHGDRKGYIQVFVAAPAA